MHISRTKALRGPNLWSRQTAIEATVACSDTECAIAAIPGLDARLRDRFPDLDLAPSGNREHSLSLAHVLQRAALALQARAGCRVSFGRTRPTSEAGVFQVVVEYSEEPVGRLALELAHALCDAAVADQPFDAADAVARLRELDEDSRLGPSTGAIVQAAVKRGIPFQRLTEGSMVQFGWGSRQRRIQAAESDRTSAIAEFIAQDKEVTKMVLRGAGVPVPDGRSVSNAEDAWSVARELGGRLVVKPRDGNQGKGVAVDISSRDEVLAAYAAARKISDDVIVERYMPGHDFRLLVVGNRLVAAARRAPPQVVGDGVHTVAQLVEQVNRDPARGDGHATSLTKIRFDAIALATLATQGCTADSVPAKGVRVTLRNNANLSTGGSATDVTDEVHPELAARAVEAAQTVGLDICGVDVVCEHIDRPLEEQGGGIVEVNAAPGLRMHLQPSFGKARAVGEAIIDSMYATGNDGRIPLVAVTGTNGKTTTVRLIAHVLAANKLRVGMTGTDGVYVNRRRIDSGDCSGPRSARNVLLHPDVDAAVFETARGGVLREGLGFDRCDVAVVTNIGDGDHLGMNYIDTAEELAAVKRVIVQNVAPGGSAVLNAADPLVAAMAPFCPGSVIFFAADRHHPVLLAHHANGGRIVYRDGDALVACEDEAQQRVALADVPLTRGGSLGFQVENTMAALGALWALRVDWRVIRSALRGFVSDAASAPGRFNVFDWRGATLIADYGHNTDAMRALVQATESMPAQKRVVVISGAGDRRDEDIRRQTEILGQSFDHVVLYEDQCQRGRADGEVLALLRQGLAGAPRTSRVQEVSGEVRAIDTALEALEPGDLCLILVDQVDHALAHIGQRVAAAEDLPLC
jgi:cyanophycin synthetase